MLLGSSGVGKTTLLNHLTGQPRPTLPVRESDDRGRHATRHRELVPLASGALVIDTPGLRLPRVWEQAAGLRSVFADIDELARALPLPRLLAPRRAGLRRHGGGRRTAACRPTGWRGWRSSRARRRGSATRRDARARSAGQAAREADEPRHPALLPAARTAVSARRRRLRRRDRAGRRSALVRRQRLAAGARPAPPRALSARPRAASCRPSRATRSPRARRPRARAGSAGR